MLVNETCRVSPPQFGSLKVLDINFTTKHSLINSLGDAAKSVVECVAHIELPVCMLSIVGTQQFPSR